MRIISGTARGTKLYTLDSLETRPTLDRVKESIFNIINQDIQNTVFLDLFSGSGAIGLEAVSRGAKKAILCDNSKSAVDIINKNIEKTHLKDKITLYNLDFEKALHKIKQENEQLKQEIEIYKKFISKTPLKKQLVEFIISRNTKKEDL